MVPHILVTSTPQTSEMLGARRKADLDVSVVLPCLNEEGSVGACVTEALTAIATAGWSGEVVVVDNGSTDASAARATEAGARVVVEPLAGYGAAIRRGIADAKGTVVVMADADATYPLDRLAELVEPVLAGDVDLMVGSRLHEATRQSMPFLHRFVGTPVITWLVKEGTGSSGLTDSQSGFRAFRFDIVERLGLRSTGMEFASEMFVRAAQRDFVVREIPLGYRDRVGESKLSTWRDGWRHLRLILRLSPQILLWKPGIFSIALGLLIYVGMVVWPNGFTVGSLTWRPVFTASIFCVLGVSAAVSGALLARSSPSSGPRTRERFAWVSEPTFLRRGVRLGLVLVVAGLALDVLLFFVWFTSPVVTEPRRLVFGGIAQGMLLSGTILVAVLTVYRLMVEDAAVVSSGSDVTATSPGREDVGASDRTQ